MTDASRLELLRPRDIGGLFRDSLNAYFRYFASWLAIGAAVVVPVELVVSGLGLGQLGDDFHSTGTGAAVGVVLAENYLLVGPLITAMVIHALLAVADGRRPKPAPAITSGLEAFRPIFLAVLLSAAGVILGFIAFILPGIYLAVRWYFVPQAAVVDNRRGTQALERSAELVSGQWWRVFGVLLLVLLTIGVAQSAIQAPFTVLAKSADSSAIWLLGTMVATSFTAPLEALMLTLLYFDLLARRSLPASVPPVQPPR